MSDAPAPLPPELEPLVEGDPASIGPFRVVGRLGAGGMGVVYGGLDDVGRCVAVKVIHARYADHTDYRQRFAREAQLLEGLDAECAPAFLGADPDAAQPWMAAEFVPGRTLSAHVREFGPLTGAALLAFAAGTAEAIAAIHAAGVIHRDIKPGNVMLAPDGPKVLDFGIARAADDSDPEQGVYGTPGYLAPERLAGLPASTASDVFAWGAMVAYAATGRAPFGGGDTSQILARVRAGQYDLTGLPEELLPAVEQALARDPGVRPGVQECFRAVLDLAAPETVPQLLPAREPRRQRLRRSLVAAWQGFDAAGHDPRAWAAVAGGGAAAAGLAALLGGQSPLRQAAGSPIREAAEGGRFDPGGPTGAESAPSGGQIGGLTGQPASAAPSTAGTTAGTTAGAKFAIAAGAVVVTAVVVTGGVVIVTGGDDDAETDPVAQEDPEGEEDEEAEESPPFDAQEVEYRGMTLSVPEDWGAYPREDVFQNVDGTIAQSDEWLVLAPEPGPGCDQNTEWNWGHPGSAAIGSPECPHIKVLGPAAIAIGGPGYAPFAPEENYDPGSEISPCPDGVELTEVPSADGVPEYDHDIAVSEDVALGEREAVHREVTFLCVDYSAGGAELPMASYYQRTWFLPDEEILLVDEWGHEDFPEALSYTTW